MTRLDREPAKEMKVPAIEEGTVIDHIPPGRVLKVVEILSELGDMVTIGINFHSKSFGRKGVVKITNRKLTAEEVNKIAILAPNATVNIINAFEIVSKQRVQVPDRIMGIVRCGNPNCITNHQDVSTIFHVENRETLDIRCHYCERLFNSEQIQLF